MSKDSAGKKEAAKEKKKKVKRNPHKLPLVGAFAKSVKSLVREDKKGLLYHMDYTADYYKLLPFLNLKVKAGCSTFVYHNVQNEPVMGRNYDLRHYRENSEEKNPDVTGLIVAVNCNNPKAKYRSFGLADAFWMDAFGGTFTEGTLDDGEKDVSMAVMLPFLCMDGVNEKGLAVSIMYLPTENRWDEIDYAQYEAADEAGKAKYTVLHTPGEVPDAKNPRLKKGALSVNTADKKAWTNYKDFAVWQKEKGKKTVFHPVLMRMMLDSCETVEEAVALARTVNVKSPQRDADYHILAADASGKSVMLEWIGSELTVKEAYHGANFYENRPDHYGYGYDRDNCMSAAIAKYEKGMPESAAMSVLGVVSQNIMDGSGLSYTQWSAVYNLKQLTADVCVHMKYKKVYHYSVEPSTAE